MKSCITTNDMKFAQMFREVYSRIKPTAYELDSIDDTAIKTTYKSSDNKWYYIGKKRFISAEVIFWPINMDHTEDS